MKLKIKYNDNINNNTNNLIISNIWNNINLLNNTINYLSGKNSNKNILLNYIKEKDHFIHRNNIFDSLKNISYKSFIYNIKKRSNSFFGDTNKNNSKSITNIYHININNNKIKTHIKLIFNMINIIMKKLYIIKKIVQI